MYEKYLNSDSETIHELDHNGSDVMDIVSGA